MPYSEPVVRFLTTQHFKRYEKFYDKLNSNALSAKEKIFLKFFGKDYKNNLDFILKENDGKDFGCYISNWNMQIQNYQDIMDHFLYPIFIGKIQTSVDSLTTFISNFKNLLGENHYLKKITQSNEYRYAISKSIGDYFKIDVHIWGVHYDLDSSGNVTNIRIIKNKSYSCHDILKSFFTIRKDGAWVTDAEVFKAGGINDQQYLAKFHEKIMKYREIVFENSEFENKDPKTQTEFPDAIIFGINKQPDMEKIVAETSQNIWKELRIDANVLKSLNSTDFYILGTEPISIDCLLALKDLFIK